MHGREVILSLICELWIPGPQQMTYTVGNLPSRLLVGFKINTNTFQIHESDATPTASIHADPEIRIAAELLAATPTTTCLDPCTVEGMKKLPTFLNGGLKCAVLSSIWCSDRQQIDKAMTSDTEYESDLFCLADASVASQRSGLTEAGSVTQKLRLESTVGVIKLKKREKKLFDA